jgi:hypothetical protein
MHGYPVCGTLHRYGTDLCNPAKLPDLWLHHGTIMAYLTDISNPAKWADLWLRYWTYQGYSVWSTLHKYGTTSAIQPSYLTSGYSIELTKVISSVEPYVKMVLTSAIQPSDLTVTSDYAMGLANYHGYPVCRNFHRYGTDLSNPTQWPDLWLRDGTGQLPWLSICSTFHGMGLSSAIQPMTSPLTRWWNLPWLPNLWLLTTVWDRPQRSNQWPLTRWRDLQCLSSLLHLTQRIGLTSAIQPFYLASE